MGISFKKTISSLMIVAMLVCIIPCQVFAAGKTGWRKVGEEDYRYYITSTKYATGWKKINGYWYYFGKDGLRYRQLSIPDYGDNGNRVIDGKTYFFKKNGKLRTSCWIELGAKYAGYTYVTKSGAMVSKGWHKIKNKWYYFIDGYGVNVRYDYISRYDDFRGSDYSVYKGHYFNANGSAKKKGWWDAGGTTAGGTVFEYWYYFTNNKGTPASGWKKINKKWYYFAPKELRSSSQGYWFLKYMMVHDCSIKINGKKYKFNSKGVCTNP